MACCSLPVLGASPMLSVCSFLNNAVLVQSFDTLRCAIHPDKLLFFEEEEVNPCLAWGIFSCAHKVLLNDVRSGMGYVLHSGFHAALVIVFTWKHIRARDKTAPAFLIPSLRMSTSTASDIHQSVVSGVEVQIWTNESDHLMLSMYFFFLFHTAEFCKWSRSSWTQRSGQRGGGLWATGKRTAYAMPYFYTYL